LRNNWVNDRTRFRKKIVKYKEQELSGENADGFWPRKRTKHEEIGKKGKKWKARLQGGAQLKETKCKDRGSRVANEIGEGVRGV